MNNLWYDHPIKLIFEKFTLWYNGGMRTVMKDKEELNAQIKHLYEEELFNLQSKQLEMLKEKKNTIELCISNFEIIKQNTEPLLKTLSSDTSSFDSIQKEIDILKEKSNKEEIKGYSFAITNSMEELKDDKIMAGKERIFVEINVISNRVLVRYTQTIKNKIMNDTYEKIVKYIQTL